MANSWGIPEKVELRIRNTNKCDYCGKKMLKDMASSNRCDWPTIEHLRDGNLREQGLLFWKDGKDGLKEEDIAVCCWSCNSSRGRRKLKDWFKKPYCIKNEINEDTVAQRVKDYIRRNENSLTSFQQKVFAVVTKIPKGSVLTYKEVATRTGSPSAFRAVGSILKSNFDPNIPCHRVIRSDGTFGNYNRGGTVQKRKILLAEGAPIL